MDFSVLPIYLLNAISLGLLLGLIAAGLTFIFGFLDIVNFAHGSMYMLGAYVGYQIYMTSHSFWLALLLSPLIIAGVGILLKKYVLGHLKQQDPIYVILLTYGLAIFAENLTKIIWTADIRSVSTPPLLSGSVPIFGTGYPIYKLFMIVLSVLLILIIYYLFNKTKIGIMVRAGTEDREMAASLGINTELVGIGIFAFGTGLAAFMGVIAAPIRAIEPTLGVSMLVDAFVVMVIGGMKSFSGAIVAGMFVGFIQIFGGIFFADLTGIFTLLLMIIVILTNQKGLGAIFRN